MKKLQAKRSNFNGMVGYYCITGCPSFDVLRVNLVTKKAVVSYFHSEDVFQTDIELKACSDGVNTYMNILIFEDYFKYDLATFTLTPDYINNIY